MNADTITAYENDASPEGINVLFADGHVEFLSTAVANQKIEAQTAKKKGGGL